MANPGGYAMLDIGSPTTSGITVSGIYAAIGRAYNSGKMLIIESNLTKTPAPLYVISIEDETVTIEDDNGDEVQATFPKYTLGKVISYESNKNYSNTITIRYNDEVKVIKTEIAGGGGSDLPPITGQGGKLLAVKNDASGIEWKEVDFPDGSGHVGQYLMHSTTGNMWYAVREVPVSVASMAGQILTVGESGTPEWGDAPSGGTRVGATPLTPDNLTSTIDVTAQGGDN